MTSPLDAEVIHDPDAERAVIGVALHTRGAVDDANLQPGDFYVPAHEHLWGLLVSLAQRGQPTDPVTVARHLGELEAGARVVVTHDLIHDCQTAAPVAATIGHYAGIVAEYATRRRLIDAGVRIAGLARTAGRVEEIAEAARGEVDAAYRGTSGAGLIGDDLEDFIASLDRPTPSVPTPWDGLNRIIGGWRPGAMYVIAARPSIGKSIMGLQAAIGLADHGHVAFTSLEMSRRELQQRAMAHIAQVALGRLKGVSDQTERLSEYDRTRIATEGQRLAGLRLSVNDRVGSTVNSVRSHARSVSRRGPLAGIVVDYLGLLESAPGDRRPRWEQVTTFSRQLKSIAMEMQVPVLVLAQLNRQSTQRADTKPQLSDLRDTGAVEQDADVVMLLHADNPGDPSVDCLVAKNRAGEIGVTHLTKRGMYAEFTPRHTENWS